MSDTVRNDDLMGRLRLADPVHMVELERETAPLRERVKARAIAAGSTPAEPIPAGDRIALETGAGPVVGGDASGGPRGLRAPGAHHPASRRGPGRRGWLPLGFASLGCAAVLAAILLFLGGGIGSGGPGAKPEFADAAVKVAEANPRLLITAPGWRVEEARSFKPRDGQLELGDSAHQVHLAWQPASDRRPTLDNEGTEGRPAGTWTATIAGRKAIVSHVYDPGLGSYFSTVFPAEGGIFVSLGGVFAKRS